MSGQLDPIRRSVFLRSCVERPFRIFTGGLSTWWPLGTHSRAVDEEREGVTAVGVRVEPWTGGWLLEELSTREELPWGETLAWEPPARLIIAWKPDRNALPPTELEVIFRNGGEGTRVTLEHRGWERLGDRGPEARMGYADGWPRRTSPAAALPIAPSSTGGSSNCPPPVICGIVLRWNRPRADQVPCSRPHERDSPSQSPTCGRGSLAKRLSGVLPPREPEFPGRVTVSACGFAPRGTAQRDEDARLPAWRGGALEPAPAPVRASGYASCPAGLSRGEGVAKSLA